MATPRGGGPSLWLLGESPEKARPPQAPRSHTGAEGAQFKTVVSVELHVT